MPTLHLGVMDVLYRGGSRGQTTHDVAMILEAKYGLLGKFWQAHGQEVVDLITKDLTRALTRGEKPRFQGSMSQCEHLMKTFISSREAERVGIPGVPTKAALLGVNHRLAHPTAKGNPRRPSFRDTGLMEASYKAWIT